MKGASVWRNRARPIIAGAIEEGRRMGLAGRALLAHIQESYPFGERALWPYRVWLDEIRVQLGRKPGAKKRGDASQGKLF